jgi:hypothetical protein
MTRGKTGLRAYGNKRDASEAGIVEVLRVAGALVYRLDRPCDLLVYYRGVIRVVEVKTGKGKLTENQKEFRKHWPLHIIRDVDGALEAVKLWSSRSTEARAA